MIEHPSPELLARWLEGQVSPDTWAAITEHVQTCPQCEQALEGRAARPRTEAFGNEPAPVFPDLPGYEILAEIGRGGMGVVYKARQLSVGRLVAVKLILTGELADAEAQARFRREAESVARLHRPDIVQLFDFGEHEGKPFMSMELCAGGSLADRLARQPLPPRDAATLVRALAGAVQAAHTVGIIHRDLKPANVLFDSAGQAKIADFGLARRIDDAGHTATGAVVGTPSYMPPEQARGGKADERSDVYALGAVLYECLTGRPPFQSASSVETLLQVLQADPLPVRRLNPSVSRDLETICHKCLEKNPARRYATAQELADDLGRYLAGEPIRARPVGRLERGVRWVRRNPVVSALTAAIFLVLATGVTASWLLTAWALREATNAEQQARETRKQAEIVGQQLGVIQDKQAEITQARDQAQAQLRRAEWLVYAGKLAQAQSALTEGKDSMAVDLLDACQWDLRGWEHRHLWSRCSLKPALPGPVAEPNPGYRALHPRPVGVCGLAWGPEPYIALGGDAVQVYIHFGPLDLPLKGAAGDVAWSPDGKRLLTGSHDNTARVFGLRTARAWDDGDRKEFNQIQGPSGELLILRGHTSHVVGVAWSPDGSRILTGSEDRTARVWDAVTGKEILKLEGHTAAVTCVAWSPDGKRLLTGSPDKTARTWDAATGRELGSLPQITAVRSVAWSPDGKQFVLVNADDTARVWDAGTGLEIRTLKGAAADAAWSPDGKRILTGSAENSAKVWDAATGEEIRTLKYESSGHPHRVRAVAWSRDGKRIAAALGDRVKLWYADFDNPLPDLYEWPDWKGVTATAWSPDGKRILTGHKDTTARIWDAETGKEVGIILDHAGVPTSVAWSPDGKWLLTNDPGRDHKTRVWDAETGRERLTMEGSTSVGPLFSPDGKRILTASGSEAEIRDAKTGWSIHNLVGHNHTVSCVAWSPDGRRILTGSDDQTARVWDAQTGTKLLTLTGHTRAVSCVAFSLDGKRILTASQNKDNVPRPCEMKVWDAETGREVLAIKGHMDSVLSVAWSPDGKRLLTGSKDRTAKVWDTETGQEILTLKGHAGVVGSVAWSPDGSRILTGDLGGPARVWDAGPGQDGLSLKGHTDNVICVAWSPDGKRLLTGSEDGTARVWDAEKGQELLALKGHRRSVLSVAWTSDGKRIVSLSNDSTVRVWDARTGKELHVLELGSGPWRGGDLMRVAGSRVVIRMTEDQALKVWDIETGKEVRTLPGKPHWPTCVTLSPNGRRLLIGRYAGTVEVRDTDSGGAFLTLEGHTAEVRSGAWSLDGKWILTTSNDRTARVWDAETGREIRTLKGHSDRVISAAWSPDGQRILTASTGIDDGPTGHALHLPGEVKVWSAGTGEEVLALRGGWGPHLWSPDGKWIFSGGDDKNEAKVWDAETGRVVRTLRFMGNYSPGRELGSPAAAWSPDGKRILTAGNRLGSVGITSRATVWNLDNGR